MRRYHTGRDLTQVHSIAELAAMARQRLPHFAWEYLAGGAEEEQTLSGNRQAFAERHLHARALVPCQPPATERSLWGETQALPLMIGPTGYNGMLYKDADLHLARAATARGVPFCLSTVACAALETIAERVPGVNLWFQLYPMRDPAVQASLLARARAAGVRNLVVTSDAMVLGNREWDRRNFTRPRVLSWRNRFDVLRHPRWMAQALWPHGLPTVGNLNLYLPEGQRTALGSMKFIGEQMDTGLDWDFLARLRQQWEGRLLLKGVLHPADAERCIALGLDGVVVSNHGGRQLDGALASLDALEAIVPVARGKLELLLDGGIRRGSDIVKALALGADSVLLGRATLYGVAVGGEAGAGKALDLLADELRRCLNLAGCTGIDHLGRHWLAGAPRSAHEPAHAPV
ncbi:alpha-hydroxy acid oxidase [Pseudomonas typographi]|uniref:Alpha-hydroxy-acid oxidizing protein n=1 Tax=Pseudomonas typographi TaxID=2715964 RepID=A0ABR7Z725_9PSED|nr:alpha-hydroxy acid oxidase [Pseudomonas typographi]MBD1601321.1 alpha-hydroxy-acid oxidizing protein [Pseudomonas typographi]